MKMAKLFIVLMGLLLLFSCKPDERFRLGYLDVDVRYTGGADQWELDGVKIALRRVNSDNLEQQSVWIDKAGKQRIELPFGKYELVLHGNRCKLVNTDSIININSGEPTSKAISIEHLGYSVVVKYRDKEMKNGDTISFSGGAAIDIWNKYSSNDLKWAATTFATDWIRFTKNNGIIGGHKTDYALFEIGDLPNYGTNCADIIITTQDEGTFTIVASTFKPGGEPEKAIITGDSTNTCPALNVMLTASAPGATSYKWYKGSTLIDGNYTDKYNVTASGYYSVVGLNANGCGVKSDGKYVTINSCEIPPEKATIIGDNKNICPATHVMLTADAPGATSFKWYNGKNIISAENGGTYMATQTGVYYAVGINKFGSGIQSDGKAVTISKCGAVPSKATISGNSTNSCSGESGKTVLLTAKAIGATNFIWRKEGEQLSETGNILEVKESGVYYVSGRNDSGEGEQSVGKKVDIKSCIPENPVDVSMQEYSYGGYITLSWSSVNGADEYKIQVYDNPNMEGGWYREFTTSNTRKSFYPKEISCGWKYFRIIAMNDFGESTGAIYAYEKNPSITPKNYNTFEYGLYLDEEDVLVYVLDNIAVDVDWYEGSIYFDIQRSEDGGPWLTIDTLIGHTKTSSVVQSYSDYSFSKEAEAVQYRVRAYIETSCGLFEGLIMVE